MISQSSGTESLVSDSVAESAFAVDNMFCGGCAATVERAVRRLDGVVDINVSFLSDTAIVQHDQKVVTESSIREAIARLGYATRALSDKVSAAQASDFEKQLRIRLGVALGFGLWVMMAGMVRLFIDLPSHRLAWSMGLFSGIASIPVLVYSAGPFLKLGWLGLRERVPGMESLIFIATVAAVGGSIITLSTGGTDVWFDVPVMLVIFQLMARLADFGTQRKAANAVRELLDLSPVQARRIAADSAVELVPLSELKVGDLIQSHAGERLSMDGVVTAGQAHVDTGLLSGESMPEHRQAGDEVHAGTLNLDGVLTLRVDAILGGRRMDVLAASVGRLLNKKTNLMKLADSVAFWLVPLLLIVATGVAAFMLMTGNGGAMALERALTVLVVSCPCALSLAVPLVVAMSAGSAARHGIVLRDASALEKAHRVDTILIDKTGTLTAGRPRVVDISPVAAISSERLLALTAKAGFASHHPLMSAIREHAQLSAAESSDGYSSESDSEGTADTGPADTGMADTGTAYEDTVKKGAADNGRVNNSPAEGGYREYPGKGLENRLASGERVLAGSRRWLLEQGIEEPVKIIEATDPAVLLDRQGSEVCVAINGQWSGCIYLNDALREDAEALINTLRNDGKTIMLVSGDRRSSVQSVAEQLGIEWRAEYSPEDKAALVQKLSEQGHTVAFVGDGLNDGPALAAASIGIATGKASDLARSASSLAVLDGGLERIVQALALTSRSSKVLRSNIFWALAYNSVLLPLAIFGFIHPHMAVIAMGLSTLSVSLNSLRAGAALGSKSTANFAAAQPL